VSIVAFAAATAAIVGRGSFCLSCHMQARPTDYVFTQR